MRSSSLARVVIASLGVSLVITLGCSKPPAGPSPPPSFSALSISPTEGSSVGGTVARIEGDRFQSGDTVTVDGSRVDATVLSATTISLTMPAHAAGQVKVSVSRVGADSQAQVSPHVWFTYIGPPVISELLPNIGSTGGGAPITIRGDGFRFGLTVTVGGIVTPFEYDDYGVFLYLSTPAHAAGTVEVIVTNPDGRAGSGMFTYVSPATLDFNGDWQGYAWLDLEVPSDSGARLVLTIRDNIAVSFSCTVCRPGEDCAIVSVPSLTLDPTPVVANGEFSFAGSGGVSITGKILSPGYATGSINTASCGSRSRQWWAEKK